MRVRTVQRIDYWLGVPICAALTLWQLLVGRFVPRPSRPPRRIAFVELSEMGTAILAHSALRQARREFEDAELFFVIFESNAESVALLDLIPPENVLTIRQANFLEFTKTALAAVLRMRALGIDTVIDMELFSRFTALFSYATGAANRVGFHQYSGEGLFRGRLGTHRVLYNPHQHIALNLLGLVYALRAPAGETPLLKQNLADKLLDLPPRKIPSAQRRRALELLMFENPAITNDTPLILINAHPGEILPIRGWPADRFVELARRLLKYDPEFQIVLIGLPEARELNERIMRAAGSRRCIDLSGKTHSLEELVALFSLARVMVTNDGGPAHFASLTEMHSVVLFGPETPALYGPVGSHVTCLYASYGCSPCVSAFNHRVTFCTDNKCLQAIAVDQVLSATVRACRSDGDAGTAR